jgi:prolyl oligopeptidase PreP (S9A serine peptidase family)
VFKSSPSCPPRILETSSPKGGDSIFKKVWEMKKVTSVGGTFFKCEDPKKMNDWYSKNLGLVTNDYGSLFEFRNRHNPEEINYLQ